MSDRIGSICVQYGVILVLCHFRSNNWSIPILVGGDFNMDMKSYDISDHPELLFVPYRPLSGKNLRDFKNTFLFTLDNLQVNIKINMKP